MRWIVRIVALGVFGLLGYGLLALGLSEAAEVVVLETRGEQGEAVTTRLWIVDGDGFAWLRAGGSDRAWYRRIVDAPGVELLRGDRPRRYRAIPVQTPEARERINRLMAEKYGLADRLVHGFRDLSAAIPIRLEEDRGADTPAR